MNRTMTRRERVRLEVIRKTRRAMNGDPVTATHWLDEPISRALMQLPIRPRKAARLFASDSQEVRS